MKLFQCLNCGLVGATNEENIMNRSVKCTRCNRAELHVITFFPNEKDVQELRRYAELLKEREYARAETSKLREELKSVKETHKFGREFDEHRIKELTEDRARLTADVSRLMHQNVYKECEELKVKLHESEIKNTEVWAERDRLLDVVKERDAKIQVLAEDGKSTYWHHQYAKLNELYKKMCAQYDEQKALAEKNLWPIDDLVHDRDKNKELSASLAQMTQWRDNSLSVNRTEINNLTKERNELSTKVGELINERCALTSKVANLERRDNVVPELRKQLAESEHALECRDEEIKRLKGENWANNTNRPETSESLMFKLRELAQSCGDANALVRVKEAEIRTKDEEIEKLKSNVKFWIERNNETIRDIKKAIGE